MTRQHGFTLVEVMVVVAILGVLTTLAVVSVRGEVRAVDVAANVASLVEEASRIAVRRGPLDAATASAEGSKRRTRLRASGSPLVFSLEVLGASPTPAWTVLRSYALPNGLRAHGFAMQVGPSTAVTVDSDWTGFELGCFPDGTCDGATLFFAADQGPTNERRGRLSVLPLGSATHVTRGWQ